MVSDTGAADPRLAAALGTHAAAPGPASRAEVLAALAGARVFAAITATSTSEHLDAGTGLRAESSAELSLLTLVGSAGGLAVPLFLDAGAAVCFRDGARPVPLPGPDACGAALDAGAVAVLLDPPGAPLAVSGAELTELAAGRVPIAGTTLSTRRTSSVLEPPTEVDPALVRVLGEALGEVLQDEARDEVGLDGSVRAARLLEGPEGLVLVLVGNLSPPVLAGLAARLLPRVRAVLPSGGLDLAVSPDPGPGVDVPFERGRRGRGSRFRRGR